MVDRADTRPIVDDRSSRVCKVVLREAFDIYATVRNDHFVRAFGDADVASKRAAGELRPVGSRDTCAPQVPITVRLVDRGEQVDLRRVLDGLVSDQPVHPPVSREAYGCQSRRARELASLRDVDVFTVNNTRLAIIELFCQPVVRKDEIVKVANVEFSGVHYFFLSKAERAREECIARPEG
jgi:hypothetical protein